MASRGSDAARSLDSSRLLKFKTCHVKVSVLDWGAGRRVNVSAGATMNAEEALELAEAILEARRTLVSIEEAEANAR